MPRSSLKVHMVRSRGSALGTIVKENIVAESLGEIKHIHEMMPYGLLAMSNPRYNQVARENRERIDLDIVLSALASDETHADLLCALIVRAQEAFAGLQGFLVNAGGCR